MQKGYQNSSKQTIRYRRKKIIERKKKKKKKFSVNLKQEKFINLRPYLALTIDSIVCSSCGLSSSSLVLTLLVAFTRKEITLIKIHSLCACSNMSIHERGGGKGKGGREPT